MQLAGDPALITTAQDRADFMEASADAAPGAIRSDQRDRTAPERLKLGYQGMAMAAETRVPDRRGPGFGVSVRRRGHLSCCRTSFLPILFKNIKYIILFAEGYRTTRRVGHYNVDVIKAANAASQACGDRTSPSATAGHRGRNDAKDIPSLRLAGGGDDVLGGSRSGRS